MKNWTVETLNKTVDKEILSLNDRSRYKLVSIIEMITRFGLENLPTLYTKHIKDKIWEIKADSGRLLYVTVVERKVVILHAFEKKTNKLPTINLDIAIKRLKLLEERGVK